MSGEQPPVPTTALVRAAGITYRQADYWSRKGILRTAAPRGGKRPERVDPRFPGSGYTRMHPASEVAVADAIRRLLRVGLKLDKAAPIARAYVDDGEREHPIADGIVLTLEFMPATPPDPEEPPCSTPET